MQIQVNNKLRTLERVSLSIEILEHVYAISGTTAVTIEVSLDTFPHVTCMLAC